MCRSLSFILITFLSFGSLAAQVTSSALKGRILSTKNDILMGAAVTTTHEPTGTVFRAITDENGYYQLENMIIGGPYVVKISYIGFKENSKNNIFLSLGKTGKWMSNWRRQPTN